MMDVQAGIRWLPGQTDYLVGADFGQLADYSTVSVVARKSKLNIDAQKYVYKYEVGYLERFKLGTEYPIVIDKIGQLMRDERLVNAPLVVDATGPGLPIIQSMRATMHPIGVFITSGHESKLNNENGMLYVPRTTLLTTLVMAYQLELVQVVKKLELAPALSKEMAGLKMSTSWRTGNVKVDTDMEHDDLAMCVALPLWYAENFMRRVEYVGGRDETISDYNPLK